MTSPALLFSNNVKLYCPIVNQLSSTQLQQDLLILMEWSRKWLLNFIQMGTIIGANLKFHRLLQTRLTIS